MWSRCCSRAVATVDLPEADSPVNQTVKPRWPRNWFRSCRVSDGCQVILLAPLVSHACERECASLSLPWMVMAGMAVGGGSAPQERNSRCHCWTLPRPLLLVATACLGTLGK